MGVVPLQFMPGETAESLGLSGHEVFSITGLDNGEAKEVTVIASADKSEITFKAKVRIDTPQEIIYMRHGGILHYVLRQLAA